MADDSIRVIRNPYPARQIVNRVVDIFQTAPVCCILGFLGPGSILIIAHGIVSLISLQDVGCALCQVSLRDQRRQSILRALLPRRIVEIGKLVQYIVIWTLRIWIANCGGILLVVFVYHLIRVSLNAAGLLSLGFLP